MRGRRALGQAESAAGPQNQRGLEAGSSLVDVCGWGDSSLLGQSESDRGLFTVRSGQSPEWFTIPTLMESTNQVARPRREKVGEESGYHKASG